MKVLKFGGSSVASPERIEIKDGEIVDWDVKFIGTGMNLESQGFGNLKERFSVESKFNFDVSSSI